MRSILFISLFLLTSGVAYSQPQRIERNVARSKATLAQALAEVGWKDSETVTTQGYKSAGDGGGGTYIYHKTGWSSLTNQNKPFFVRIGSTDAYLELKDKRVANVKQAGAAADWNGLLGASASGTDDSAIFIEARNAAIAEGVPLYIPEGDYYLEANIGNTTIRHIKGSGSSLTRLYNDTGDIINLGASSGCVIEDIGFHADISPGAGIRSQGASDILVTRCYFSRIGNSTGGNTAIRHYVGTGPITVTHCKTVDCAIGGADAHIQVSAPQLLVTHNICEMTGSNSASHGISGGPGTGIAESSGTFSFNIVRNFNRHGLNILYNQGIGNLSVVGNVIKDCGWTAIYCNGNLSPSTGQFTIANNICTYCAGGDAGLSGTIYCDGALPYVVSGNLILNGGQKSDGSDRASATTTGHGIRFMRNLGASAFGNFVGNCRASGITVATTGEDCSIASNNLKDNVIAISVSSQQSGSSLSVDIVGNTIFTKSVDGTGIVVNNVSGGNRPTCNILSNNLKCEYPSTTARAIHFSSNIPCFGSIKNNTFTGWDHGIWQDQNFGMAGLEYGEDCVIGGNTFRDIVTECFSLGRQVQQIVGHNDYVNCTAVVRSGDELRWFEGEIKASGQRVIRATSTPVNTVGTWNVGDLVINSEPSIGEPNSWICTVAGAPGTWTPVYDYPVGFAQISIEDNATATTVASTQSDWSAKSQFVGFGTNFADSSNATPDHTNDHITLTSAGTWEVSCVVTLSGSVVSDLWELALWKNNGATQVSTKQGVNIRGAGLTYEKQVTISGLVDASANDTIELWVQRTNGTGSITITNAVMTAKKVSD